MEREFICPESRAFKVGEIVYKSYRPQRAGKIVSIGESPCQNPRYKERTYTVALPTKKGIVYEVWGEMGTGTLLGLIEDHAKKIKTHQAHYDKLVAMEVE